MKSMHSAVEVLGTSWWRGSSRQPSAQTAPPHGCQCHRTACPSVAAAPWHSASSLCACSCRPRRERTITLHTFLLCSLPNCYHHHHHHPPPPSPLPLPSSYPSSSSLSQTCSGGWLQWLTPPGRRRWVAAPWGSWSAGTRAGCRAHSQSRARGGRAPTVGKIHVLGGGIFVIPIFRNPLLNFHHNSIFLIRNGDKAIISYITAGKTIPLESEEWSHRKFAWPEDTYDVIKLWKSILGDNWWRCQRIIPHCFIHFDYSTTWNCTNNWCNNGFQMHKTFLGVFLQH